MNNNIKISIIIPVYNAETYISRCLESLVAQTYTNLELIAINDGSTDGSGQLLDKYAAKDSRIKVIHISNNGVSNARNLGIQNSSGDYVGFVDSDDWVEPFMYESLIGQITYKPYDIVQCAYDSQFEDGSWEAIAKGTPQELIGSKNISSAYFKGHIYQSVFSKIYKKSILKDIKFDIKYPVGEDSKFVYECCKIAESVKITKDIGYHYFIRSTSVMNGKLKENHFLGLDIIDYQLTDVIHDDDLYQLCIKREAILCMDLMYRILYDSVFNDRFDQLRNRVIKRNKIIFPSSEYSLKFKLGVLLLWISPYAFKKLYIFSR